MPASLAGLWNRYKYSDRDAVAAYLEQHPFLIPVLNEASAQIPRYFELGDVPLFQVV